MNSLTSMTSVISLFWAACGNIAIYMMVTLIQGIFFPSHPAMKAFYGWTDAYQIFGFPWLRLLIVLNTCGLIANICVPMAYRTGGALVGGLGYAFFTVIGMLLLAIIYQPDFRLGWQLFISVLLFALVAVWIAAQAA